MRLSCLRMPFVSMLLPVVFCAAVISTGEVYAQSTTQDAAHQDPVHGNTVAGVDPVTQALSGYHFSKSVTEMEAIAGGREALITRLLQVHRLESPPFVGVRATKILLSMTEDARVADALAADMSSYLGLARVITTNVDLVNDDAARRRFAKLALERAGQEPAFVPYARSLKSSKDAAVSRLAKEKLP